MIKIKAEISDGKGYHKVLILICDVKMRDKAIAVAERFLRCGLDEMGVRSLQLSSSHPSPPLQKHLPLCQHHPPLSDTERRKHQN